MLIKMYYIGSLLNCLTTNILLVPYSVVEDTFQYSSGLKQQTFSVRAKNYNIIYKYINIAASSNEVDKPVKQVE